MPACYNSASNIIFLSFSIGANRSSKNGNLLNFYSTFFSYKTLTKAQIVLTLSFPLLPLSPSLRFCFLFQSLLIIIIFLRSFNNSDHTHTHTDTIILKHITPLSLPPSLPSSLPPQVLLNRQGASLPFRPEFVVKLFHLLAEEGCRGKGKKNKKRED
jgi:hypothetical protein